MISRIWKCAFCGLVLSLLLVSLSGNMLSQSPSTRIEQPLSLLWDKSALEEQGCFYEGTIPIIIQYNSSQTFTQILHLLTQIHGEVSAHFDQVHLLAVRVPYSQLARLSGFMFSLDRKIGACLDQSVPVIKPAAAWTQVESYFGFHINGSGIRVAVLDTGIETSHPDLDDLDDNGTTSDPKVILEKSFVEGNPSPEDDNGHGTHVAGIIGGTGKDSGGVRKGVAPGCWLLNGKVLDSTGSGYESWVIAGIEWALNNSADVINLSLAALTSGNGTDPLSLCIDHAVRQGVPVVLAAGKTAGPYRISIPGVAKVAITVGASDGSGLLSTSPSGPTTDFRIKPDLLAPGKNIYSCDDDASGYVAMSGTSQAAAHVAGAVAILLQVHPTWTPDQIKTALLINAKKLNLEPYAQGSGRVYVPSAINTSILLDPVADFQLLHPHQPASQLLTLTNLRPYAVQLSFAAQKYGLNLTNPFTIPGMQSRLVNVSLTPNTYAGFRISEYINFSVEQKSVHVLASGVKPNLTLSAPSQVPYNATFTLTSVLALDQYPIAFLNHSSLEIRVNTTVLATLPIHGNCSFSTPLRSSTLFRGTHNLTVRVYIETEYLMEEQVMITIIGYGSSLTMQNWTAFSHRAIHISVADSQNISGRLSLYIWQQGNWVLLDTANSPSDPFQFQANFPPSTYQLKVCFTGDPLYEPSEALFTLILELDVAHLLFLGGVLALVVGLSNTGLIFYEHYHLKQRAKTKHLRQLKAEAEQERDSKALQRYGSRKKSKPVPPAIAPPPPPPAPSTQEVDAEVTHLNTRLQTLVKSAQTLLHQGSLDEAAQQYYAAADVATTLHKPEMVRVYSAKGDEILESKTRAAMHIDKGKKDRPSPVSNEERIALENKISSLLSQARKESRAKNRPRAAKLYREIAALYEQLHDEANASLYRQKAKVL